MGALVAITVGAQASVSLVAEYDTVMGVPFANTMVSVSINDLLAEEFSGGAVDDGYNAGIAYTVTPTMGENEAIRTLTVPKVLGGNYYVEFLNNSTEGVGLGSVTDEGDSLYMVFQNANLSFVEGKTLEFVIYNDIGGGIDDLNFSQNLDIQTQTTYVGYANGQLAWEDGTTTITSSQNYTIPSSNVNLPEPSSALLFAIAVIPMVFRRKRIS